MKKFLALGIGLLLAFRAFSADLLISTNQITSTSPEGNAFMAPESFTISCTPDTTGLMVVIEPSVGWLAPSPTNALCTPAGTAIDVHFEADDLPAGTYTGRITCTSDEAENPPQEVTVILELTPESTVIRVHPQELAFTMIEGSTNVLEAQIEVWNGGSLHGRMDYTITVSDDGWLSASPTGGTSFGETALHTLTLTNLAALPRGQHVGSFTIFDGGTVGPTLPITLEVMGEPALATYSTNALTLVTTQGVNIAAISMWLGNSGGEDMPYRASADDEWLMVHPSNSVVDGGSSNMIMVSFETADLPAGPFSGNLLFHAPTNLVVPQIIPVELTVHAATNVPAITRKICQRVSAGSGISTQRLEVWNAGTGGLVYTLEAPLPWFSVSPTSGVSLGSTQYHDVVFSTLGLPEGRHTSDVRLRAPAATPSARDAQVSFQVDALIGVLPTSITNHGLVGGSVEPSTLQLWNAGSANPIPYAIAGTEPWLSISPTSGVLAATPSAHTLLYSTDGLSAGVYRDVLEISSINHTQYVQVELRVREQAGEFLEKIVFASDRAGDYDLWVIYPSGAGLEPLIQKPGMQSEPEVSPDGTWLAYADYGSGVRRLVLRDMVTGAETEHEALSDVRWMADSSAVIGQRTGDDRTIWRLSRSGGGFSQVFREREGSTLELFGLNKKTNQLYYSIYEGSDSEENSIKIAENMGRFVRKSVLQEPDSRSERGGRLSANGRLLLYSKSQRFGFSPKQIHLLDRQSGASEERPLSSGGSNNDSEPEFSPLNDRVVFARSTGPDNQLVLVELATSNETVILSDSHMNRYPSWGILFQIPPVSNVLMVHPLGLTNTFTVGGTGAVQSVIAGNAGRGWLSWSISNETGWVWTSVSSGTSTGNLDPVEIGLHTEGLDVGTHTGKLTFTANASNAPVDLLVVAVVEDTPPALSCDTTNLACHVNQGSNTSKRIVIWNSGGGTLAYQIATNRSWLSALPASGSSTGEEDTITIEFDAGLYSVGTYNGLLTLTSATSTQEIPVQMTVQAKNTNNPILTVFPLELTNTTTQYRNAPSQSFAVWNSGGKTLEYYLSEKISWLKILPITSAAFPASSRGERDVFTVHYTNQSLGQGLHETNFFIHSNGGTQTVYVALEVLAPLQYALTVTTSPGGWVTKTPDHALYTEGASVLLTARPSNQYQFVSWRGDAAGSVTQATVRMDGGKNVRANFTNATRIWGYLTNLLTGAPISNGVIRMGGTTNRTNGSGYYSLNPPNGWGILTAVRTGYPSYVRGILAPLYTDTRQDIGLMPNMVSGVRALQRPGTKLVDIFYTLSGLFADRHNVSLSLSQDGGRTWTVPACSQAGDHGPGIRPSVMEKQISWNAGACWDGRRSEQMRVRLLVAGRGFESGNFTVDTRGTPNWRVRAWADKNGDNAYNAGEEIEGAGVYYGFVRTNTVSALTDSSGYATVPGEAVLGRNLFVRGKIYERSAVKEGHSSVDGRMYTLFLDNDIGGEDEDLWDGTWRGSVITRGILDQVERGLPVYIRLKHPVFEWNLLVAFEGSSTDTVYRLRNTFRGVSMHMYDVTDGQMKLGKVRIRSNIGTGSTEWKNADVHVYDNDTQWPKARVNGIYQEGDGYVHLGRRWTQKDRVTVFEADSPEFIRVVTHELGHYIFNYYDEYLSGVASTNFKAHRAAHTNIYPRDYGLMQANSSELSSYNDYLASYPSSIEGTNVTAQIWKNNLDSSRTFYPCWQWLERAYEKSYSGYRVGITVPQYGTFVNGLPTSQDREGPFFVPSPYVDCVVFTSATLGVHARMASVPRIHAPTLLVTQGGQPVRGAQVTITPAGHSRPRILGRTRFGGRMSMPDAWEGDMLAAYHNGYTAALTLTAEDAGKAILHIELPGPQDRTLDGTHPLSTNRLGIVATGLLVASNEWDLQLHVSLPLASNPVVQVYPDAELTNLLVLTSSGGLTFTGRVPFAHSRSGLLLFNAQPSNDLFFSTLDSYALHTLDADQHEYWSRDGRASISFTPKVATNPETLLMVHGAGPVILSPALPATNQAGAMLYLALSDPTVFAGGEEASLRIQYSAEDIAGLDESSLRLYHWNEQAWHETPSLLSMEDGTVYAILTNLGAYVLLAHSTTDVIPPSPVTDLVAVVGSQPGKVTLSWTAPGNDDTTGTAAVYDLRYSTQDITESSWDTASRVLPFASPLPFGTPQAYTVRMAVPDAVYYFALRALDEAGNAGAITSSAAARAGMTDSDGDGIPDDWMASVNLGREMPMEAGDDADGDGLTTWDEYDAGTAPGNWDTDGDGLSDGWELTHNLNPLNVEDADEDSDGDGLTNLEEYGQGTNPQSADTDGDGMTDRWEIQKDLDPLTNAEDEGAENDPDEDTFSNLDEFLADTWPKDPASFIHISGAQWNDRAEITFPCSTARVYEVDWSPGLEPGQEWQTLFPPGTFYGPGEAVTITNTGTTGGVYRIRVWHP